MDILKDIAAFLFITFAVGASLYAEYSRRRRKSSGSKDLKPLLGVVSPSRGGTKSKGGKRR